MTDFVLFQGGSGSKVASALAHLIAIGMFPSDDIVRMQLCDKDNNNKDTTNASEVIGLVAGLSDTASLRPNAGNRITEQKACFKTQVIRDDWNFTECLARACGRDPQRAVDLPMPISEILVGNVDPAADRLLLNAFFDKHEQSKPLKDGFVGCASRGAVIYSYMLQRDRTIFAKIEEALAANNTAQVRVFIVGSIFGGTGASMFLKTVQEVKALDSARVHVAGALILPSFCFHEDDNCEIKSKRFWPKTFTSLQGYLDQPNLVKKGYDDDAGLLDRLYFVAQPNNELHNCVGNVTEGGQDQWRKSDFIDVVAASYILDFFKAPATNGCYAQGTVAQPCTNLYTLKYPDVDREHPLTFDCVPGLEQKFVIMLKFSSLIFKLQHSLTRDLDTVDWLRDLFPRRLLNNNADQLRPKVTEVLTNVYNFCCAFVDFAKDISENGERTENYPEIKDYSANYSFLHKNEIDNLHAIRMNTDGCTSDQLDAVLRIRDYCMTETRRSALDIYNRYRVPGGHHGTVENAKDTVIGYINALYAYTEAHAND